MRFAQKQAVRMCLCTGVTPVLKVLENCSHTQQVFESALSAMKKKFTFWVSDFLLVTS